METLALVAPQTTGRLARQAFGWTGRRRAVRPYEAAVHAEAVTAALTVHGKRVVTYRWGDGDRPVLLVHGWRSRAAQFAPLVARLREHGYSPVAFDAPGHGSSGGRRSHAYEFRAVIERMQDAYGRFDAIVAHSFGVPCAFLALRGGVEADRLVAISGPAGADYLVGEFARQARLGPRATRAFRERLTAEFPDLPRDLSGTGLTTPLLVVHDTGDTRVRASEAQKIITGYGVSARLRLTSGRGHQRILGAPEVLDATVEFLSGEPAVA